MLLRRQSHYVAARILGWPFKWLGLKAIRQCRPQHVRLHLWDRPIKFGQILSTRPDVVGEELALQLRVLQDKLPPFSNKRPKPVFEMKLT